MLSAIAAGSDIVLTLDSITTAGFQGWQLERQIMGNAWQYWTGTAGWGAGVPLLLTTAKFIDTALANGLYAYRATPIYTSGPGTAQLTQYVNIGESKIGWTFENYTPPSGQWGELLTADDLRYTYLWGVVAQSSEGDFFTDAQIRTSVAWSVAAMERILKITMKQRVIKCDPILPGLVQGVDYDEEESGYTYRPDKWNKIGYVALKRRPVSSIQAVGMYSPTGQKMVDLLPWTMLDKPKGLVRFYPQTNNAGQIQQTVWALSGLALAFGAHFSYPMAFRVDYTAGYQDAGKVPDDLRDIVGKLATVKLLNLIGDGLIAGFSSSSVSIDGLSESFSSTQSPESTYFGARIKGYLTDIEDYVKENRTKFGNFTIGSI